MPPPRSGGRRGTALAVRHVPYQGLAALAPVLASAGYAIDYRDAAERPFRSEDLLHPDLVILLGGPFDVDDPAQPFLAEEIACVERRIAAGGPTLGICLGAQVLARGLGARVAPLGAHEIGWHRLALSDEGLTSPLAHLAGIPVLHWHGDTFEQPPGTKHLASTPLCRNQAFSLGRTVLGLQFHIEVSPLAGIDDWIEGHAADLARLRIADADLRSETEAAAQGTRDGVARFLETWLSQLP